ncbi:hypothetical protein NGRA_3150 [Nosema granulosis]|uniref:Uncharacterized protein n=1 Tax=Nosema granulosis TaxID=83296 RepID=A0A9P6GXY5_9MICR|nr:hypothetical protein NGRA_3150 [Nosema granulosis]
MDRGVSGNMRSLQLAPTLSISVLQSVVSPELNGILPRRATDLEKHLTTLIKYAYPSEDASIYTSLLSKTYQKDFKFIDEYYEKIEKITTKLKWTLGLSESDYKARISEYFYQGLDYMTKIEMAKQNLKQTTHIKAHIQEIERTIINLSRENQGNFNDNSHEKRFEQRPQDRERSRPYCKYHKTSNHSTEECRTLARKNQGNLNSSRPQNLVLKEPDFKSQLLQINGIISGKEMLFTIDTGATNNFISEKCVEQYKLTTTETSPTDVTYGNGQTSQSTRCVHTS